ncbi:hypothetical protein OPQ81_002342 [Rhizoctonia solani]|nr:hypothetical protein OPQ81_002342 [Rhizoctonia solani]
MPPKPGNSPLVYDENLLAKAPEVSQGQREEGYDADILNPSPPPASRTQAPSQPYRDHPDVESGSSGHDKHPAAGGYDSVTQPQKKPFWKTPKGLIILAVLAVAVIAAVVGGAVGGTVGKNKSSEQNNSANNGLGVGSGSEGHVTASTTSAAQPPGETVGGGGGVGGGSSPTTTSGHNTASPSHNTSTSSSSPTTAIVTSPNVEPSPQLSAGEAPGASN